MPPRPTPRFSRLIVRRTPALAACIACLCPSIATGRVYRVTGMVRTIEIGVLAAAAAALLLGYRFVIFLITLYSI